MQETMGLIISNEQIADATYRMEIKASITEAMTPGQFVNIKVKEHLLRRPISIASIEEDAFVIVYRIVGDGTRILSEMKKGEMIDLFGPLGNGYPIHEEQKDVLLLGGGIGVPPLYEVAKRYRALGKTVYVALGFDRKGCVFFEREFRKLGCQVVVATMDGSYGTKGTVLDAVEKAKIDVDFVYSCGPMAMLKAIEARYQKGYTSFEARMACGIGACMACVCKDREDGKLYHRICKEGPVFAIGKVGFA